MPTRVGVCNYVLLSASLRVLAEWPTSGSVLACAFQPIRGQLTLFALDAGEATSALPYACVADISANCRIVGRDV